MGDNHPVLPSDTEKLSHKFILDAIQRRRREGHASMTEEVLEAPTPAEPGSAPEPELPALLPPALELPAGKNYFRIGEVAALLDVEAHVLRYWESEFSEIRPTKAGGQRVYRRKDVETLHWIRHLLHVEKFSIAGAKKKLKEHKKSASEKIGSETKILKEISASLRDLIRFAQA